MKFIDEKGKLFGKMNVVDLVMLLGVVALLLGGIYKLTVDSPISYSSVGTSATVQYVVKIEGVRDLGMIREGDVLYDKDSNGILGTIVDVTLEQATDRVYMPNGEVRIGELQDRVNFVLTLEANGFVNEKKTYANSNYEIVIGSRKSYYTKYIEFAGMAVEVL
ncbi:MAG: DUF4330 domain-containing protein [Bacillota bacterium]